MATSLLTNHAGRPILRLDHGSGPPRMRVLCVLSSSNQMYSGIGRNVFELSARLADRVEYTFAVDDRTPRNADLVARFGREHGFAVHVGRGRAVPEALDAGNEDLPALLRQSRFDAIECLCWANAATNDALLREAGEAVLAYTPHHQPSWTVPMSPFQAAYTEEVHHRVVRRADIVFCDSPWERAELQALAPHLGHCRYLPLGCDFSRFRPGTAERREQLLFVGDLAEPRKRFDRALELLGGLLRSRPTLRLVVIGNRSDEALGLVPEGLRHAVELRGYVDEPALRRAYAESLGLVLLSDFEAFGIPILEALACGTPVFLSEQAATRSLFGTARGAHFCPADDPAATLAVAERTLALGREAVAEALADRPRLQATFDWEALAEQKWRALAAAWFRKHSWAWPA
jgi:glycosyltransferase involved in cell wall biosynthesis